MSDIGIVCDVCGTQFNANKNLYAHLRNKHGQNPIISRTSKANAVCNECGGSFSTLSNMRAHMKNVHGKENVRTHSTTFPCQDCQKGYADRKGLKRHREKEHGIDDVCDLNLPNISKVTCSFCEKAYSNASNLLRHIRNDHLVEDQAETDNASKEKVSTEELQFDSMEEFQIWKHKIEISTVSQYVKARGDDKRNPNRIVSTFECNRSGMARLVPSEMTKRIRRYPTIKINKKCHARIVVAQCKGRIDVKYMKIHSHEIDPRALRLTTEEKEEIAEKLSKGVAVKALLADVAKKRVYFGAPKSRMDAVNRKDLWNIMKAFDIKQNRCHEDDATSVDIWVSKQFDLIDQSDNAVTFYKRQGTEDTNGVLEKKDFMLVIMTKYQKMMANHLKQRVLVDSTHGTNKYDFQLTTVLTVDEFGAGCPVAFCISNRIDCKSMCVFFQAVKNKVGESLSSRVFMSDMANSYYNAWCIVMGTPTFRLYCSWHVMKAWKKELVALIKNKVLATEIWHCLLTVLVQVDEDDFEAFYFNFLEMCHSSEETIKFGEYIKINYGQCTHMWGFCFRKGLSLTTNMFLEAMHKKLKYCYLDGKVNRRVDSCIQALLEFEAQLHLERYQRLIRGTPTYRQQQINKSHEVTQDMINHTSKFTWTVLSSTPNVQPYTVVWHEYSGCDGCPLSCPVCHVCVHRLACTCPENIFKGNFCKHMHSVIHTYKSILPIPDQIENNEVQVLREEIQMLNSCTSSAPIQISGTINAYEEFCHRLDLMKSTAKAKCQDEWPQLIGKADRFLSQVRECETVEDYSSENEAPLFPQGEPDIPNNKRVQKQRRFYSTKVKPVKTNTITKPSATQCLVAQEILLGADIVPVINTGFDHNYNM